MGENNIETKYLSLLRNLERKKKKERERDSDFRENWVEIRFSFESFKDSRYWNVSVGSRGEANGRGLKYPTDRIIDGGKL